MHDGRFQVLTVSSGQSRLDEIAPRLNVGGTSVVGHRVASLEEAVQAAEADHFDCILLDVGRDAEAAKSMRFRMLDKGISLPIIVIADGLSSSEMVGLLRANVADCITSKDLSIDRVVRAIWNATRSARTERALSLAESQRVYNVLHDHLTDLPNRSLFFDRLDQALTLGDRQRTPLAILTCNINGFNRINGEMGHEVGDQLLRAVAERIASALRRSDTLARLGDDEFGVILPTGASQEGAERAAAKIIAALDLPFELNDHTFSIGVRIGIALYPTHGTKGTNLLVRAENAMRDGRRDNQRFAVHVAGRHHDRDKGRPLVEEFKLALEDGDRQLFMTFQPKINLRTQQIHGVEALVRWRHPDRGMVFPDAFIPLAEDAGLIDKLTMHVLNHTLAQQTAWRAEGIDLTVAVNLSAKTLQDARFPAQVQDMMRRWSTDPTKLVLEITESAIILDVDRATATLNQLDSLGIGISIDDFGTGYTCLSYIRRLPVEELKVDKSFVIGMSTSPDDWVIVSSLIELGHNLGMTVVAEGVEDEQTLRTLCEVGCDYAQGYYMARPLPADDLTEWLLTSPWGLETAMAGGMAAPSTAPLLVRRGGKTASNVHELRPASSM